MAPTFNRGVVQPENHDTSSMQGDPGKDASLTVSERKQKRKKRLILFFILLTSLLAIIIIPTALLLQPQTDKWIESRTTTGLQTTLVLISAQNISIDNNLTESKTTTELQTTLVPISAQNITIDNNLTESKTTTELQTTLVPISAQNITIGSRGRAFIVLFMTNIEETEKSIYVTSENGVQMNISTSSALEPELKSHIDQSQNIPSNIKITIPTEIQLQSFRKETKSILLETSDDVFVISRDRLSKHTVGGTTHIPVHKLSTSYVVISTSPVSGWKSQLAVAAIEDYTNISITFQIKGNKPLSIAGVTFYNRDSFNFSLDRFETYEIAHTADLTGTFIQSSCPIAAFSGNDCNTLENIGACDHLLEQLPPINSLDKMYIVPPNSNDRDTLIRITAIENSNLTITISGTSQTITLSSFGYFDTKISSTQTCTIESSSPILVTNFGLHSKTSNLGDPSMTTVPGTHQYLDYYKIVVPLGYDFNYVSIMILEESKLACRINATTISAGNVIFDENVLIGNLTYNVRTIKVTEGEMTASTLNGERFGLIFAGVTYYEAYGFSGNSVLL